MKTEKTTLRPPYVLEYNKLCELFWDDPTIEIGELDDNTRSCDITVHDTKKATYLRRYLNLKSLNYCLNVKDNEADRNVEEELAYLLSDSPYFSRLFKCNKYSAVLMTPDIIGVDADNAFSPTGYEAFTAQQIARELFHGSHCNIQTDFEC